MKKGRRCEIVLGNLEGGTALLYSSGLAAVNALLNLYRPKRGSFYFRLTSVSIDSKISVYIENGYHMTHGTIDLFGQLRGKDNSLMMNIEVIDISKRKQKPFQKGDLVFIESPSNPTCEMFDIEECIFPPISSSL